MGRLPARNMISIGQHSTLQVTALLKEGIVLSDGEEELLLPSRHAPEGVQIGQDLEVFVYSDSENQLTATTQTPYASVGDFAFLEVVDIGPHGAFLDWGLEKDLFVPNNQQHQPMHCGKRYVVAVYLDERTSRVAAASQLAAYFDYDLGPLRVDQEVSVLVYGFSDLGAQVVVDNRYSGLIYSTEIFQNIDLGDKISGYIRAIRGDNKLDISLRRSGRDAAADALNVVLRALESHGGYLSLTDRSTPEDIYDTLGISKKAFKMSVGRLYKARRIVLDEGGIRLLDKPRSETK